MILEVIQGGLSEVVPAALTEVPDSMSLPLAAGGLVVAHASTDPTDGHALAPVISIFSREPITNEAHGLAVVDGGSGEGGEEGPNRAQTRDLIHTLADGEYGRGLYTSDRPHIALDARKYLRASIWPGVRPGNDVEIGRYNTGSVEVEGHTVTFEASYLDDTTKRLVDELAKKDERLGDEILEITINPVGFSEDNYAGLAVGRLKIYIDFPKGGPATFLLESTPKSLRYNAVMERMLSELGFDDFKAYVVTGNYFDMARDEGREEEVLGHINNFIRRYAADLLDEPPSDQV